MFNFSGCLKCPGLNIMIEHCMYWKCSTILYCGISSVADFHWFPSLNLTVGKRMAVNFVYVLTSATNQDCQTDIKTCT